MVPLAPVPLLRVVRTLRGRPAEVWVYVQAFRGVRWLHVRWMRLAEDGVTWEPTTRGATVPADSLDALAAAVTEASRGERS